MLGSGTLPLSFSTVQTNSFDCERESTNNDSARSTPSATAHFERDVDVLRHGGQTPDLIRSLQRDPSAASCDVTESSHREMRPTVTLSGSGNDGSYEIDIQNVFPQTFRRSKSLSSPRSPVQANPAQICAPVSKKNLEFRTFQDKYPHSLYKPMHGVDARDVTLQSLRAKMEVEERLQRGDFSHRKVSDSKTVISCHKTVSFSHFTKLYFRDCQTTLRLW